MKKFLAIVLLMAVLCSSASALVIDSPVTWTVRTSINSQEGGFVEVVEGGHVTANARVDLDGGVAPAGRLILNGGDFTSTVDFKHPDNNTGLPCFIGIYDGTFTANQFESFGLDRDATIEIGANGTLIVNSQYSYVTVNDGNRYNVGNMILEGSIYASSGYDLA